MIVGIGVDVVDVARFGAALERTPGAARPPVHPRRARPAGAVARRPVRRQGGGGQGARRAARAAHRDAEVRRDPDGRPHLHLSGRAAEVAAGLGVARWHVSLSHDGGVAIAYVIAEGGTGGRTADIPPGAAGRATSVPCGPHTPPTRSVPRNACSWPGCPRARSCNAPPPRSPRSAPATLGRVYGSRVAVLAGGGDNGGDALFAGARLARRGARVEAILASSRVHQAGLAALRAAGGRVVALGAPEPGDAAAALPEAAVRTVESADLIVDGLVGIGGSGALREPYALAGPAGERRARHDRRGGRAERGGREHRAGRRRGRARRPAPSPSARCKIGLLVAPGASRAGALDVIDIGIGPYLPEPGVTALTAADVADRLPRPTAETDKYRRGVVGVVAGSDRFTGAAVLAVGGAVRGGAGHGAVRRSRRAGAAGARPLAGGGHHDPRAGRRTSAGVGQGAGLGARPRHGHRRPGARARPRGARHRPAAVLDADGLTLLARDRSLLRAEPAAHPARRRAVPAARRARRGHRGEPPGARAARRRGARRHRAAQGPDHARRRARPAGAGEPTGTPWLATGAPGTCSPASPARCSPAA